MANKTHRCDTQNPQRPCCWAARVTELNNMRKRDAELSGVRESENHAAVERMIEDGSIWR